MDLVAQSEIVSELIEKMQNQVQVYEQKMREVKEELLSEEDCYFAGDLLWELTNKVQLYKDLIEESKNEADSIKLTKLSRATSEFSQLLKSHLVKSDGITNGKDFFKKLAGDAETLTIDDLLTKLQAELIGDDCSEEKFYELQRAALNSYSEMSLLDFRVLCDNVFYTCASSNLNMTKDLKQEGSELVREIEENEVLEFLEGPSKDEQNNDETAKPSTIRVRVLALKDNAEGWVNLRSFDGTIFLHNTSNPKDEEMEEEVVAEAPAVVAEEQLPVEEEKPVEEESAVAAPVVEEEKPVEADETVVEEETPAVGAATEE